MGSADSHDQDEGSGERSGQLEDVRVSVGALVFWRTAGFGRGVKARVDSMASDAPGRRTKNYSSAHKKRCHAMSNTSAEKEHQKQKRCLISWVRSTDG